MERSVPDRTEPNRTDSEVCDDDDATRRDGGDEERGTMNVERTGYLEMESTRGPTSLQHPLVLKFLAINSRGVEPPSSMIHMFTPTTEKHWFAS